MLSKYTVALVISAVLTALVTLMANVKTPSGASAVPHSAGFRRFRNSFLLIYYIAMTADWLQGPYVYALYSSYGFDKSDIAVLFVGGFGASMVFGTFAGAAADRFGRKRLCQLYCLLYIASCATKHAKDYWVLMLGRVLGGVATSLLFSSFESWVVCEHNSRGYGQQQLSELFSLMYTTPTHPHTPPHTPTHPHTPPHTPTPPLLHPYYSTPTPPLLHPYYSTPSPPLLHPYSTPTPPPL